MVTLIHEEQALPIGKIQPGIQQVKRKSKESGRHH
jgi:hypothetical protein